MGTTYDEAIRRLPKVHSEIEALFDLERRTTPSQRALNLVRERIGAREAELFQAGVVDPEWDVTNEFRELAMELKGSVPEPWLFGK